MGRRPDGNRYNKRDLTRNESFRQIFTTLGWTPPALHGPLSWTETLSIGQYRPLLMPITSLLS
jgi:hypothetical protein